MTPVMMRPARIAKPKMVVLVLRRFSRSLAPKYWPIRMLPPVVMPRMTWVRICMTWLALLMAEMPSFPMNHPATIRSVMA